MVFLRDLRLYLLGCDTLTNINCSLPCRFQTDGKCCCDSVLQAPVKPVEQEHVACPYLVPKDGTEKV